MRLYLDTDFKCHVAPGEGLTQIETEAFDDKCDEYIEGYRYIPAGETWTREDGVEFTGTMIAPWRPWDELDAAQREYERQQLAEAQAALAAAPTVEEIAAAIREGANSI